MEFAIKMYGGGEIIYAKDANHETYKQEGVICGFCRRSVFLCEGHFRGEDTPNPVYVSPAWKHYKITPDTPYCENRSLSKEGKKMLKQFSPQARNQRLSLFNRRFWSIFKYGKRIDYDPYNMCLYMFGEDKRETIDYMVEHCRKRWNVPKILAMIPTQIDGTQYTPEKITQALDTNVLAGADQVDEELIEKIAQKFEKLEFTVLRQKILYEVVAWLGTDTAKDSFRKLICQSYIVCYEIMTAPIRTQYIQDMAISSLVLTDWEKSIEAVNQKHGKTGVGFNPAILK